MIPGILWANTVIGAPHPRAVTAWCSQRLGQNTPKGLYFVVWDKQQIHPGSCAAQGVRVRHRTREPHVNSRAGPGFRRRAKQGFPFREEMKQGQKKEERPQCCVLLVPHRKWQVKTEALRGIFSSVAPALPHAINIHPICFAEEQDGS